MSLMLTYAGGASVLTCVYQINVSCLLLDQNVVAAVKKEGQGVAVNVAGTEHEVVIISECGYMHTKKSQCGRPAGQQATPGGAISDA